MKRYKIKGVTCGSGPTLCVDYSAQDSPQGDWVKYEDAQAAIKEAQNELIDNMNIYTFYGSISHPPEKISEPWDTQNYRIRICATNLTIAKEICRRLKLRVLNQILLFKQEIFIENDQC